MQQKTPLAQMSKRRLELTAEITHPLKSVPDTFYCLTPFIVHPKFACPPSILLYPQFRKGPRFIRVFGLIPKTSMISSLPPTSTK